MTENDLIEHLKKLKQLGLTAEEKSVMRARLVETARPVGHIFVFRLFARPLAAALMVILLLSGGAAVAAETSLPGDFLYPLKIKVNERARSVVLASIGANADWEVSRVERRLIEAEQLLVENRLNADIATQLNAEFEDQAQTAWQIIWPSGQNEASDEIASRQGNFEAKLRAHEEILTRLQASPTLLDGVRSQTNAAADNRNRFENSFSSREHAALQQSASIQRGLAELKLSETRRRFENARSQIRQETALQIDAKLSGTADLIASGKAKFDAGSYSEAFALFSQSARIAQETDTILGAAIKFNLDLSGSIGAVKGAQSENNSNPGGQIPPGQQQTNPGRGKGLLNQLETNLKLIF